METEKSRGVVLFYAWTDALLVNSVNARCNFYPDWDADLLVWKLERVSDALVEQVRKAGVFSEVHVLNPPDFHLERKRRGAREKVQSLFLGGKLWRYFRQNLKEMLGEKKYGFLVTGAFWSETMLVLRYVRKSSPDVQIMFCEEGLSAYNGVPGWLYRTAPSLSFQASVRNLLYYGTASYTQRSRVRGIYLYQPEISNIKDLPTYILPPLDVQGNGRCKEAVSAASRQGGDMYLRRSVICIADAPCAERNKPSSAAERAGLGRADTPRADAPCAERNKPSSAAKRAGLGKAYTPCTEKQEPLAHLYELLDCIMGVVPPDEIAVKPHPLMPTLGTPIDEERYPGIYVEHRSCGIETLLEDCDIDGKVLITGNSTSTLYLRWAYGKHPYVIFTDRIWKADNRLLSDYIDRYCAAYDAGKAFAPTSVGEVADILQNIFHQSVY